MIHCTLALWIAVLLASFAHAATTALSIMAGNELLHRPDPHSLAFVRGIVEVAEGPLSDQWIVLLVDSSIEQVFPLLPLLRELHHADNVHPLFLSYPVVQNSWQEQLPLSSICSGQCVVLLLTGALPEWLQEAGDAWAPVTMLVVNVNTSWDAAALMEWQQIQKATSLALMQSVSRHKSHHPRVFTSTPFSKTYKGKRRFRTTMGPWNRTRFASRGDLFPDRFQTFDGEVLRVASDMDDFPLVYGDVKAGQGTNVMILECLGSWLNFTFTLQLRAKDKKWGKFVNGTWTGLLGEVHRREKNLTINYFTVVEDRLKNFDSTANYFYEGFGFALRVPPPLPAWISLTYPFQPLVWASVLGALLVVIPALYLVNRFATAPQISLQDAAVIVCRSLLRQSGKQHLVTDGATRVLAAAWWAGALVLALSYTCNLIAVLTVPVFPPLISTIQALANSGYRVAMVDYGEFVPEALVTSQDPYLKALGERMDLVPRDEHGYSKLVQLALEGRHAIIDTYSYLRNLVSKDKRARQETYVMTEQVYSGTLAFFLPKHTPWTSKLDQGIRSLVEAGLVNKWYRDIMDQKDNSPSLSTRTKTSNTPLSLPNLQGPFIILGFGLLLGLVVFVAEVGTRIRAFVHSLL